ncbi:MAG TPA: alpha/beta fold hydrolase [Mycobacteriales bacterium]|nr:alpha/beta fold hydrolase [Mycobacteriales bacterium]
MSQASHYPTPTESPHGHPAASRTITRRGFLTAGTVIAASAAVPARPARAWQRAAAAPRLAGVRRALPSGRAYQLYGTGSRLVIGLPGTGLSAQNANDTFWVTGVPATTGWQNHAAASGYALALGESLAGGWNVGNGWPGGSQDDMAYLLQLVVDAGTFDEVFIAGFSAGGAMAWRAAAQHPEVFAAAGSAEGWAPMYPAQPIDCWHVHGTGDTTVPIRGGVGTASFTFPPAFQETSRAPRGSRVVLEATSGGHGTAGWMAGRLWDFWTNGR